MKLATRNNTVISGGAIGEDSGFSIDVNAKMFRVLSDTMYQDKVGSMVRELSCNAMDAHAMAGTPDKAFTIHVPDQLEPWFSVKDEGIGLSDDDIRGKEVPKTRLSDDGYTVVPELDSEGNQVMTRQGGLYATYGRSTKDDSDEVVGAFGLGSKTPFAYTDQFTVTSIFDGVKRIYVAVMSEAGLPVLKLQGEAETDEHPGLEVNVSVRDTDYDAFRRAIIQQLKFFRVKPVLTNNRHAITFPNLDEKILIDRDGITVYEGGYDKPLSGIWIVQGGVGYPLALDNLGTIDTETRSFAKAIHDKGAILEFPIGQIEVTASREGISYTEDVCQRIVKRLSDVAEVICKDAMSDIRALDSAWKRAAYFNNLLDVVKRAVRNSSEFDKLFAGTLEDRSGKLVLKVDKLEDIGFKAVYMVKYTGSSRRTYNQFVKLVRKTVSSDQKNFWNDTVSLYPTEETEIFVRDTNSKPVARIKHYAEQNDYPTILIIESATAEIEDKDIKKIAKALTVDASSIKRLSSLEAPKVARGQSSSTARPRAYQMPVKQGYVDMTNSREWTPIFEDIDDIGDAIYVGMDRHDITCIPSVMLVMEAAKNGLLDKPVIAVNQQTYGRIKDGKIGDALTNAEDVAKELQQTLDAMRPLFVAWSKYDGYLTEFCSGMGIVRNLADRGTIGRVSVVRRRKEQLSARIGDWMFARNRFRDDTIKAMEAGGKRGKARRLELVERYPMLRHINGYANDEALADIENYIQMVDERG